MSKLPPPINIEGMSLEAIHEAIQDCHDWPGMKHPSDHHRLAMYAACEALRLEGDLEAAQQEIAARDAEIAKMQEQFRDYVERSESDAMELRKEIDGIRTIPADRVLGEGEARIGMNELQMLRCFAGRRMSEREYDRLEAVRDAHEEALRAQLARLFGAPSADVAGLLMEDGLRRAERREAHKNRITPHNSGVDG